MSNYNPLIHHRRSIRLKGYDYSQAGAYFLTFCTQHREHFFGKMEKGEMIFNDAGLMVNEWWVKLPSKFPDIELGEFITMPNHFHGIVINNGTGTSVIADDTVDVGADPRVCPLPLCLPSSFAQSVCVGDLKPERAHPICLGRTIFR